MCKYIYTKHRQDFLNAKSEYGYEKLIDTSTENTVPSRQVLYSEDLIQQCYPFLDLCYPQNYLPNLLTYLLWNYFLKEKRREYFYCSQDLQYKT